MAKTTKTSTKTTKKLAVKALAPRKGGKSAAKKALALPVEQLSGIVLDELFATVESRKGADPSTSHSAKLMSRGMPKVAQKFGEEAVECVIEAVSGSKEALIAESADVLYHLMVVWVAAGLTPAEVWAELERRKGVSGIAEKASRVQKLAMAFGIGTSKIP
jgi:phosphoribosyl-ATP pyrophosphohydrolase